MGCVRVIGSFWFPREEVLEARRYAKPGIDWSDAEARRAYMREKSRQAYYRNKEAGICGHCGGQVSEGNALCEACHVKNRLGSKGVKITLAQARQILAKESADAGRAGQSLCG